MKKLLTTDSCNEADFKDWQEHFNTIYWRVNKDKNLLTLWGRVIENLSTMAMLVRTGEYGQAFIRWAHIFCWVCACATEAKNEGYGEKMGDLGGIMWQKYPYLCPYCRNDGNNGDNTQPIISCLCSPKKEVIKQFKKRNVVLVGELSEYCRKNAGYKPSSLKEWMVMIERIYGDKVYALTIEDIIFHLTEEVGEVYHCLRKLEAYKNQANIDANIKYYAKEIKNRPVGIKDLPFTEDNIEEYREDVILELQLEMADVVSQLLSLAIKLNYITDAVHKYLEKQVFYIGGIRAGELDIKEILDNIEFSQVIIRDYKTKCNVCNRKICSCPPDMLI